MDQTSAPFTASALKRLGLDDDDMLFAASYMQSVERLAIVRCKIAVGATILMVNYCVATALLDPIAPAFANTHALLEVLKDYGLVASMLMLVLSLLAGASLNRELGAAALPDEARRYLRWRASGMEVQVFKRFLRRIKDRLQR